MHIINVESLPGCTGTYTVTVQAINMYLNRCWPKTLFIILSNPCTVLRRCPISLFIILMRNHYEHDLFHFRVVDVGTEWRTFSNDKSDKDPSRVGASEVSSDYC